MPKQATVELYTDKSPNDPSPGIVTTDPGAGFTLVGKGNVISDADIAKYGLQDSPHLVDWDADKAKAENEAKNRATYDQNAAKHGKGFVGIEAAAKATATEKAVEPSKAPEVPQEPEGTPLETKYGHAIAALLVKGGYETVEAVESASDEDLIAVHGIAQAKLDTIRAASKPTE